MPSFEEKVAKPSVATRYQAQQENNAPFGPIVQRKQQTPVLQKQEKGKPADKNPKEADHSAHATDKTTNKHDPHVTTLNSSNSKTKPAHHKKETEHTEDQPKHGESRTVADGNGDFCIEYYDATILYTDEKGNPHKDAKGNLIFGAWVDKAPESCSINVTSAQIGTIFPASTKEMREKVAEIFNKHSEEFGFTNYLQVAHFFGQAGGETGGLAIFKENTNYSVAQAEQYWGHAKYKQDPKYPKDPKKKIFDKYGSEKFNDPKFLKTIETDKKALIDYVYGTEVHPDLGNTEPGDPNKYIGRGLHQLTGRVNYQQFQDAYNTRYNKNIDIMSDPDKVSTDWDLKILSALNFFVSKGLLKIGNSDNVYAVTVRINGGTNGLDTRYTYTKSALNAFGLSNIKLTKENPKTVKNAKKPKK